MSPKSKRLAWSAVALVVFVALATGATLLLQKRKEPKVKPYLTEDDPTLLVTDVPARRFKIVDMHEHVLDETEAKRLLKAMDTFGVRMTCLMGTSTYTFTLSKQYGFEGYHENNKAIIGIKKTFPGRFCAFVTLDPAQGDGVADLERYVAEGADGLKLYVGHGAETGKGPFHTMKLDDDRLKAIYAWASEHELPIMFHINLEKFKDEFESFAKEFPKLRVALPHFGLHLGQLDKLDKIMERYPNVYTDISFGWNTFHAVGFESMAKRHDKLIPFLKKYNGRVLFGSDMVIEPKKTDEYIDDTLRSYIQMLELPAFRFFLRPKYPIRGLALDDETLTGIYEKAPAAFLSLDGEGRLPDRSAPVPGR
jgi:predicted TIM-barrel fold metal-dependent hydrolase